MFPSAAAAVIAAAHVGRGITDPFIDDAAADLTSRLESGSAYSPADAVVRVHDLDEKIEIDEQDSKGHHRRAPYWLKKIGPWLPWVEFIGFLWFCAVWLNVPILQPWLDFGAWSVAVLPCSTSVRELGPASRSLVRRPLPSAAHRRDH